MAVDENIFISHYPAIQRRLFVRKIRSLIERCGQTFKLWYVFLRIFLAGLQKGRWRNGWGVSIDWPFGKYNQQLNWLIPFLEKHLGKTYVIEGPTTITNGVKVVFFWPKEGPKLGPSNMGPFRSLTS
jgi:hypothetical protein